MKTMKSLFGIVAILLITAMGVNAQTPDQFVTKGTLKNYHSTSDHLPTYSLEWTVQGSGNTLTTSGKTTQVTWDATPGIYRLRLTETNTSNPDPNGCPTNNDFYVEIIGKAILQFTAATSYSCANEAQTLTLTYRLEDGTNITKAANPTYFPFTITYKVVDGITGLNDTRTLTVNSEADLTITLSGGATGDRKDLVPYTPSRDLTVTFNNDGVIASTLGNLLVSLGTNTENVNTIYDLPELNPIVAE